MPLHLLGKKSWNVYNKDSIERVKRDEAEALARQEAEEQRMQEVDAERRIALLRGERLPPLPEPVPESADAPRVRRRRDDDVPQERKRKRLRNEDDTDRDIRYAKEDAEAGEKAKLAFTMAAEVDAPLHDHTGHIQLIPPPDERAIRKAEKTAELEAEKARKRRRDEDQYTMRFSNASGFNKDNIAPWYASRSIAQPETESKDVVLSAVEEKDAWGREDLRRKEREADRIAGNDPMSVMRSAQRQLRQSEKDRELWAKKRMQELEDLERVASEEKRRNRRRRRRDGEEEDDLEDFRLDAPSSTSRHHRRGARAHRDEDDGHHPRKPFSSQEASSAHR